MTETALKTGNLTVKFSVEYTEKLRDSMNRNPQFGRDYPQCLSISSTDQLLNNHQDTQKQLANQPTEGNTGALKTSRVKYVGWLQTDGYRVLRLCARNNSQYCVQQNKVWRTASAVSLSRNVNS